MRENYYINTASPTYLPLPFKRVGLDIFGLNIFSLNIFGLNIFGLNIFGLNIFGLNIFGLNIFGLNIFGLNIFGLNMFGLNDRLKISVWKRFFFLPLFCKQTNIKVLLVKK